VCITLSPVVATAAAIPRLVRGELAVTVGTNEPQVPTPTIARVSIYVVDDQREGDTIPSVLDAAATALFLM
jgi:hypothetical protein